MTTRLALVHALSPLHAGTGQAVGTIDLPIARERPTGIPLIPGSSLKGALRARGTDAALTRDAFGPDTANSSEHSGAVQFSDAHVCLLPVRSVAGTHAWVTSRYLLQRLSRTAKEAGQILPPLPAAPARMQCRTCSSELFVQVDGASKVVLEDLDFVAVLEEEGDPAHLRAWAQRLALLLFPDGTLEAPAWRDLFVKRLCLLSDDEMSFLLDAATEVSARIRLNEGTKTVAKGALWYEESLPAETVLAGIVVASGVEGRDRTPRTANDLADYVAGLAAGGVVQLGGKATVGRGSCLLRFAQAAPAGGAK